MKFFNSHISTEKIANAIENRLPASERGEFQAHLSSCAHCQNEFASIGKAINLMRRDESIDAPREAYNFAINLFRTRQQFVPKETIAQKILATLKLDVSPFSPAFGERSASASAERQMLFEAGAFDLDLRIRRVDEAFNLIGQVLGELAAQNTIKIVNSTYQFASEISKLGEFSITKIPAGTYDLILQIGEAEIVIDSLTFE